MQKLPLPAFDPAGLHHNNGIFGGIQFAPHRMTGCGKIVHSIQFHRTVQDARRGVRIHHRGARSSEIAVAKNEARRQSPRPLFGPVAAACGAMHPHNSRHPRSTSYRRKYGVRPSRMKDKRIESPVGKQLSKSPAGTNHGKRPAHTNGN